MIVYKFTTEEGIAPWGVGKWPLPKNGKPGSWVVAKGRLQLCVNGIHGYPSVLSILNENLSDSALWVAEIDGVLPFSGNRKVVGRRGRLLYRVNGWNPVNLRRWIADCREKRAHLQMEPGVESVDDTHVAKAAVHAANSIAWIKGPEGTKKNAREKEWQAARLHQYLTGAL